MTSRSDQPGEKRPFCVIPVRAVKDRRLKQNDMRVLMALGYHANRAGVCWPSMDTIGEVGQVDHKDVAMALQRLQELGYIRRLNPNDYDQKPGKWGHSNRYQLLWKGDEPLPEYEEIRSANLLQPLADQDPPPEGSGARGTGEENAQAREQARRLLAAYAAGVEQALGWRPAAVDWPAAFAAAAAGLEPEALRDATAAMSRSRAVIRLGAPSFSDVAATFEAVYKTQTNG